MTPGVRSPLALTALYDEHVRRGARMAEYEGWLLPRRYGSGEGARDALMRSAGLRDIGAATVLDIAGGDVDVLLAAAFPESVAPQAGTSLTTAETGGARVARLTDEHALVVAAPATAPLLLPLLHAAAQGKRASVTDLTGGLCGLRLLGPAAPAVLQRVSSLDLAPDCFGDGAVAQSAIAGVHAVILRRDSGGLSGYDLYVTRDVGLYLWGAVLEAGAPLGLTPVGTDVGEGWH
ncbi:MAG: hypothetical protein NVSMB65_04950 [Chloroflexota bacterium]